MKKLWNILWVVLHFINKILDNFIVWLDWDVSSWLDWQEEIVRHKMIKD